MSGSSVPPRARGELAVVVKGYPRLSETFIAQEILALEARGFPIRIISLRRPTDGLIHPLHRRIRAPVTYLPEYLHLETRRVSRAWRAARALPGYAAARRAWIRDLARDPGRNRARRFGQALVLACERGADIAHLHAHFLHTPASVARYAALLLGKTWSVSGHAKDVWTTPGWELREKLGACAWAVTCTRAGRRRLESFGAPGRPVHLAYHGVDPERFPPPAPMAAASGAPLTILSIGRTVAKKGFDVLLTALSGLDEALDWRLVHVGAGAELARLQARARRLGIAGRIEWRGARAAPDVLAAYREADLFVLASRVSADGDRDGLPNVLLEACSQGLACLSTEVGGIPELIEHRETGWLVRPDDARELGAAMQRLLVDPALRARLGRAAQRRVTECFPPARGLGVVASRLAVSLRRARCG